MPKNNQQQIQLIGDVRELKVDVAWIKRILFLILALVLTNLAAVILGAESGSGAWFGLDTCPLHAGQTTNYANAIRFQAPEDGISTYIEALTYGEVGAGSFRMAFYTDSDGRPDVKIWEGTNVAYYAGQWCGEAVATIVLEAGTYYWFGSKFSTTLEFCYVSGGPAGSHEWKSVQPFDDPFPNPWGTRSGFNSNRLTMRLHYMAEGKCKGVIEPDAGIIEGGFVR